jgi:hypothetical protein
MMRRRHTRHLHRKRYHHQGVRQMIKHRLQQRLTPCQIRETETETETETTAHDAVPADSRRTPQTRIPTHPRPHHDEATGRKSAHEPAAKTHTTPTTSTTRRAGPAMMAAESATATNQKATSLTNGVKTGTRTKTASVTGELHPAIVMTGPVDARAMTVTTTCSTASPHVATRGMTGTATGGVVDMKTMTGMVIEGGVVRKLGSLDSRSGNARLWACSRTMRCRLSRRRERSTFRSRWLAALDGAE